GCGRNLSLRESQQGQPRLRVAAVVVREAIRALGAREIATAAKQLAFLIADVAECLRVCVVTPLARQPYVLRRRLPRATELQDLRATDETETRERHELRLPAAPALEGRGPLSRAIERVGFLTRHDGAAVDDAGHEQGQFRGRRSDHDLVEQRQAFGDPT